MGKQSKRPGSDARDVHASIRAEAERLATSARCGVRVADELPAVAGLLGAARAAVESAIPSGFDYEGRRYFLRVCMVLQIEVFEGPGSGAPLVRGITFSTEDFGHAPGH